MDRRNFIKAAGVGTAGTALAMPAIAQGSKTITIVSTWGRDFPGVGVSAQRLAERIVELSEGRLQTEYFAAGERVGAFDVFDEVASGNSQAYIATDYYWTGKHPGFAFYFAVPFGMTSPEWTAWINYGGGQELWDKLSGEYGLKAMCAGGFGTQVGGWFNKEINSVDDLRGLKVRMGGLGGQVLTKVGASAVSLPGGQIYENLVSGSIDAAEWVGPYNDYFMKFYEAAQYYYLTGFHEPGGGVAMAFNASFWGTLSDWEKAIIKAACNEETGRAHDEAAANNGAYLQRMVEENGVKVRSFSDDTWDVLGEAATEVMDETREHSPLAAEITDAYRKALREIGGFRAGAEIEYSQQRNRVYGIGT